MRALVRFGTVTDWSESDTVVLYGFERPETDFAPERVGLSPAVLHRLQHTLVAAQIEEICPWRRICSRGARLLHDAHGSRR